MVERTRMIVRLRFCLLAIALVLCLPWHTGHGQATTGGDLYRAYCAPCHGVKGDGNGPEAPFLNPPPRDFTKGTFEYRSTESGSIPLDADLERTITQGLPGTAMPPWGQYLRGDSLRAVVTVVKGFSPRFTAERPRPVTIGSPPASSPSRIAAGRKVFEKLQCSGCHGPDGSGAGAVATDLRTDDGVPLRTPDLTRPWNFRGGSSVRDVYMRFRTGLDGTPMPSFAGTASQQEMWSLACYVASLASTPPWKMGAEELSAFTSRRAAEAREDPTRWGRYLVRSLGCADCHTPVSSGGLPIKALAMAGGTRWSLGPYGTVVAPNLTPDTITGIGALTDAQLRSALTRGVRRDGSRMLPFPMPWTSYANLTADDVSAVITYLRTLAPVANSIPAPEHPGLLRYLWGKFRMLVLRDVFPIVAYPGNAGGAATGLPEGREEGRPGGG